MRRLNESGPPRAAALAFVGACFALGAGPLRAAVIIEESFQIAAGWNLIHVSVEPLEKDPLVALRAIAWESLWTWLPDAAPGASQSGGRWLVCRRDAPDFLKTLERFTGPASYAIFAQGGGMLAVRGVLRPERPALRAGFQLYGPGVDGSSPPALSDYFSRPGVRDHVNGVFEHSGGAYRRLGNGSPLRAGTAYWVLADQPVTTPEPLRITSGFGGLRFDSQTTIAELEIDMAAAAFPRPLELRARPSLDGVSGTDWLEVLDTGGSFQPLGAGASIAVPAGVTTVRVALRAVLASTATPKEDQAAFLELTQEGASVRVSAELEVPTIDGIWVGEALLSEVERPSFHGGGYAPAPPVSLALILEVPAAGKARLLPCVQTEADRSGRRLTYRREAALFNDPVELSGSLGSNGTSGTLTGSIHQGPDDPLNPYRHRYHPEHGQGYDVTRTLALRFGAKGPDPGPAVSFASVGTLTGVWEEVITGLAQEPVRVRGSFRLRRLGDRSATPCTGANP
jgi:hypothetical protein